MKTILEIQNLKCSGCENKIRKELGILPFVNNVEINVDSNTISFDGLPPDTIDRIIMKLSELGYPLIQERNSLGKRAKSYVSCAIGRIQK